MLDLRVSIVRNFCPRMQNRDLPRERNAEMSVSRFASVVPCRSDFRRSGLDT